MKMKTPASGLMKELRRFANEDAYANDEQRGVFASLASKASVFIGRFAPFSLVATADDFIYSV